MPFSVQEDAEIPEIIPTEVESLIGDASKAKNVLGWEAEITFRDMVREMVNSDLELAMRDQLCINSGFYVCDFNE